MGAGDDFDGLYLDSRERLARQMYALTGNRAEAAEVVQESFVRAWQHWGSVADYDDPEAWVRKVAYRLAVSRWRRRRRVAPLPSEATVEGPSDAVVASADLVAGLRQLPPRPRQALVLHYLGGLSLEEVATEMGAPLGTVKSWLSRGRDQLGAVLAPEGGAGRP